MKKILIILNGLLIIVAGCGFTDDVTENIPKTPEEYAEIAMEEIEMMDPTFVDELDKHLKHSNLTTYDLLLNYLTVHFRISQGEREDVYLIDKKNEDVFYLNYYEGFNEWINGPRLETTLTSLREDLTAYNKAYASLPDTSKKHIDTMNNNFYTNYMSLVELEDLSEKTAYNVFVESNDYISDYYDKLFNQLEKESDELDELDNQIENDRIYVNTYDAASVNSFNARIDDYNARAMDNNKNWEEFEEMQTAHHILLNSGLFDYLYQF